METVGGSCVCAFPAATRGLGSQHVDGRFQSLRRGRPGGFVVEVTGARPVPHCSAPAPAAAKVESQ